MRTTFPVGVFFIALMMACSLAAGESGPGKVLEKAPWVPTEWFGEYAVKGTGGGILRLKVFPWGWAGERHRGELTLIGANGRNATFVGDLLVNNERLILFGTQHSPDTSDLTFASCVGELSGDVWRGSFGYDEMPATGEVVRRSGEFILTAIPGASRPNSVAEEKMDAKSSAFWPYDSTLDMPFAMVTPPPGYTVEGNVAWAYMPPVSMYSMWVRFVNPDKRTIVEIAVPVAVYREPWDAAGPAPQHDAAGVLRTFVQPILAAVSPDAEIGEIRESTDSPLLEATRIDLAKSEEPFLAAGRIIREAKADAAEMTATSGTLRTRFSVAAWSFLFERESSGGFSSLGKWTGLLCVTAPVGRDVPDAEVRSLLDSIRINPEWRAIADKELSELSSIEESPPFFLPEEKERWNAMNRSGMVLVPLPGRPLPAVSPDEYAPLNPVGGSMPPSGRYTFVNAAIDGCFLGFKATAKAVDIENINPLVLFP